MMTLSSVLLSIALNSIYTKYNAICTHTHTHTCSWTVWKPGNLIAVIKAGIIDGLLLWSG